ncbi:hypothetical protein VR5_084 [Escherichia phage vb_EcoM-VR5]|uniref:Thioredoxin n=1 Tax=Escherichia phage vb_EcoM-VR5 TaxID=1567026 RepID=A0A0A7HC64_9CAUD|nr:hypothetical protein AVV69_gp084 [Escherichia phage vb_EcoM-VR5]AIZ01871.1 hypothetical protein VR5_084 [Escherichia phage vb_EcoM-VR5]
MKNRLREDIAAASNTGLLKFIKEAEDDEVELIGKIHGCDDYSPVNWDAVMAMVSRREQASKNVPNCPECGTEQVQLVHWQTSNLRYKCRHCKHKFERDENGKA